MVNRNERSHSVEENLWKWFLSHNGMNKILVIEDLVNCLLLAEPFVYVLLFLLLSCVYFYDTSFDTFLSNSLLDSWNLEVFCGFICGHILQSCKTRMILWLSVSSRISPEAVKVYDRSYILFYSLWWVHTLWWVQWWVVYTSEGLRVGSLYD